MEGNNQLCIWHWSTRHVAKWLQEEGFCEYVDILCDTHKLDYITDSEYDLRSPPLEIKVLGDIKRLMLSICRWQKHHPEVLEELGCNGDVPIGSLPTVMGTDWFCNGEAQRDCDDCEHVADFSADQYQYANGKNKHSTRRLDPEYWKIALSCIYVFTLFGLTSFVMTYPPLPDIFLDRCACLARCLPSTVAQLSGQQALILEDLYSRISLNGTILGQCFEAASVR
uniref:SAM domain-containing protein n=1 Tax=Salvator merianae TaxID=96440 RepID=A0A8D0DGP4_SALMN